jgi:hypothetical protein
MAVPTIPEWNDFYMEHSSLPFYVIVELRQQIEAMPQAEYDKLQEIRQTIQKGLSCHTR